MGWTSLWCWSHRRRARALRLAAVVAIAALLFAPQAIGHGDVHVRIDAITAQIRAHPEDATLYRQRAALYEIDEDWRSAVTDLERARTLGPTDEELDYRLARAVAHTRDPARAIALLDPLLATHPEHLDARVVRARAYAVAGRARDAERDYDVVVQTANPPAPEYYVERAQVLAPESPDRALRGLRDGVQRLGPLVSFIATAVTINRTRGDPDGALQWIAMLPPPLRDSAEWRRTEGDLEDAAGRHERAIAAWQAGVVWIDALPPVRQRSEQMRAMRGELNARLAGEHRLGARNTERANELLRKWAAGIALAVVAGLVALRRRGK